MKNGIQSLFLSLGNESCFFLQLLNIAEKETGMPLDVQTSAWLCTCKDGWVTAKIRELGATYQVRYVTASKD